MSDVTKGPEAQVVEAAAPEKLNGTGPKTKKAAHPCRTRIDHAGWIGLLRPEFRSLYASEFPDGQVPLVDNAPIRVPVGELEELVLLIPLTALSPEQVELLAESVQLEAGREVEASAAAHFKRSGTVQIRSSRFERVFLSEEVVL